MSRRILVVAAVAALLAAMLTSGAALAAKGGKPGGGKPTPVPTGTCYVTPNPVGLGSQYTIVGSGLKANTFVDVFVSGSGGTGMMFARTDATGAFSVIFAPSAWLGTNTVVVDAYNGGKLRFLTSCTFQVM